MYEFLGKVKKFVQDSYERATDWNEVFRRHGQSIEEGLNPLNYEDIADLTEEEKIERMREEMTSD